MEEETRDNVHHHKRINFRRKLSTERKKKTFRPQTKNLKPTLKNGFAGALENKALLEAVVTCGNEAHVWVDSVRLRMRLANAQS